MMSHKAWFAVLAIGIALTGVFSGLKWLTLVALAVWITAMLIFGTGKRSRSPEANEDDS